MSSGGGDWKALHAAAKHGDEAEARVWLSSGVDPNLQHLEFGETPLIAAAAAGHLAIVELLVAHGADVSIRSDWDDQTAEEAARLAGYGEVASWLAERASPRGAAAGKRALIVIPGVDFDPTETAIPWRLLREAGLTVSFATPDGAPGAADPRLLTGKGFGPWRFLRADTSARHTYAEMVDDGAYQAPVSYADMNAGDYELLHLPGGHAPGMKPYLESDDVQDLIAAFFADDNVVGAICHGVLAVARSRRDDGRSVLFGRKTTALPARMELMAWRLTRLWLGDYYRTYPTTVEEEVTAALASPDDFLRGPRFVRKDSLGDPSRGFVVVDGNYVSGRWPGDVRRYATTLVEAAERRASEAG